MLRLILAIILGLPGLECSSAQEGLIAAYDFNEGEGADARDASDNALHARPHGQPFWTAGVEGWGIETKPGAFMVCKPSPLLNPSDAVTVEAWVKVLGPPSTHKGEPDNLAGVVSNRSGPTGYMLAVSASAPHKATWVINGLRPGGLIVQSKQAFATGEWAHLAGVFAGDHTAAYLNGQETLRKVEPAKITTSAGPVVIGAENLESGYYQLSGVIDRVRIYSRALTPQEIKEHASFSPIEPKPPQLAADGTLVRRPIVAPPGGDTRRLVIIAQEPPADFVGSTDQVIRSAIEDLRVTGGGTILIRPGEYRIRNTIALNAVRDIALVGQEGTMLKFANQFHATLATQANKGDTQLSLDLTEGLQPGDQLEVQAKGRVDAFSKYQVPYFMCGVKEVADNIVTLSAPLRYDAPAGTKVVCDHNLFYIGGSSYNLTFDSLTLDGNIREGDVRPIDHVQHCALAGSGGYNKDNASQNRPTNIKVLNCTIRNFYHRGIAWYSFADSVVASCRIENTGDEAIDFDHYCVRCSAVNNTIRRCGVGVEINDASDSLVAGNTIEETGTGVTIWRWYHPEDLNRRNVVINNRLIRTRGVGIRVGAKTDTNHIRSNIIHDGAGPGINLDGDRNSLIGNQVTGNAGGGIIVKGKGNILLRNVCRGNGGEAQIEGTLEGNIVSENNVLNGS